MKSHRSAASGHCDGDSARGGDSAAGGCAMGMGSRDCVLVLWLLTLHSRSRIRRLKLSGTVQGLVQDTAALDDRTM